MKPQVYQLVRLLADGVSIEEAARQFGWTVRAAESHLLRARRTVRAALAKAFGLIGAILAYGRRSSATAATMTAATAASVVLMVTPWAGSASGPQVLPATTQAVAVTAAVARLLPAAAKSAPRLVSSPWRLPIARPISRSKDSNQTGTSVKTPVAGVREYDYDNGQHSDNVIQEIQNCVNNLQVSINYQGC